MAVACPNMSVVVIVPYYNESKIIKKTLDSINNQITKPNSVMLVDSGSTDKTSEIINEWIDKSKTKLFKNIYSGEMSPSSSINLGIKSSEEKIIAYIDCGLDIPSNWLESSLNQMNKNNSDMVSIRIFTAGKTIIDKSINVAIVSVPATDAQNVIDLLVLEGIKGILNYAPISPKVPEDVVIRNIDPILSLQSMAFYLKKL